MNCPKCHKEILAESLYCSFCGTNIHQEASLSHFEIGKLAALESIKKEILSWLARLWIPITILAFFGTWGAVNSLVNSRVDKVLENMVTKIDTVSQRAQQSIYRTNQQVAILSEKGSFLKRKYLQINALLAVDKPLTIFNIMQNEILQIKRGKANVIISMPNALADSMVSSRALKFKHLALALSNENSKGKSVQIAQFRPLEHVKRSVKSDTTEITLEYQLLLPSLPDISISALDSVDWVEIQYYEELEDNPENPKFAQKSAIELKYFLKNFFEIQVQVFINNHQLWNHQITQENGSISEVNFLRLGSTDNLFEISFKISQNVSTDYQGSVNLFLTSVNDRIK